MRDVDVIQVFKSLGSFSERKAEIYAEGQAQGHDMGVIFAEPEGRGTFGERV